MDGFRTRGVGQVRELVRDTRIPESTDIEVGTSVEHRGSRENKQGTRTDTATPEPTDVEIQQ